MFTLYWYVISTHTPTTVIYPLSLHDALPILLRSACRPRSSRARATRSGSGIPGSPSTPGPRATGSRVSRPRRTSSTARSEEHTSELQSLRHLVCRLLLEKKKDDD